MYISLSLKVNAKSDPFFGSLSTNRISECSYMKAWLAEIVREVTTPAP